MFTAKLLYPYKEISGSNLIPDLVWCPAAIDQAEIKWNQQLNHLGIMFKILHKNENHGQSTNSPYQ